MTPTPLVIEALREAADKRRRVATLAAAEVRAEKAADAKKDVRSSAVKVTELLADAAELDQVAKLLEAGDLILSALPGDSGHWSDGTPVDPAEAAAQGETDDGFADDMEAAGRAALDGDLPDEDDDPDDPDIFEVPES